MDIDQRSSRWDDDRVIVLSKRDNLNAEFSSISPRFMSSLQDLPRRHEPKAIVIDREFSTADNLAWLRRSYPTVFIAVFEPSAAQDPCFRMTCFDEGVNMVAHDVESILTTLEDAVTGAGRSAGRVYSCPYCNMPNLSERDLYYHCPAFHINVPNDSNTMDECPICRTRIRGPLQVHIHMDHGPDKWSRTESHPSEGLTRLYNFSLVMCRHPITGKFLLCQEFANQGFWCPGGAVDAGEMLTVAAKRETMEEAGIDIELKGILSVEYNPIGKDHRNHNLIRLRVVFYAEPSALGMSQLPKSIPDFESAGACWCSAEEILHRIRLRGSEPRRWVRYLDAGGMVYPLALLEERSSSNSS